MLDFKNPVPALLEFLRQCPEAGTTTAELSEAVLRFAESFQSVRPREVNRNPMARNAIYIFDAMGGIDDRLEAVLAPDAAFVSLDEEGRRGYRVVARVGSLLMMISFWGPGPSTAKACQFSITWNRLESPGLMSDTSKAWVDGLRAEVMREYLAMKPAGITYAEVAAMCFERSGSEATATNESPYARMAMPAVTSG